MTADDIVSHDVSRELISTAIPGILFKFASNIISLGTTGEVKFVKSLQRQRAADIIIKYHYDI